MILGPKNAIDLKIINIYNLERTSTLLFSLEIFLFSGHQIYADILLHQMYSLRRAVENYKDVLVCDCSEDDDEFENEEEEEDS